MLYTSVSTTACWTTISHEPSLWRAQPFKVDSHNTWKSDCITITLQGEVALVSGEPSPPPPPPPQQTEEHHSYKVSDVCVKDKSGDWPASSSNSRSSEVLSAVAGLSLWSTGLLGHWPSSAHHGSRWERPTNTTVWHSHLCLIKMVCLCS